MKNLLLSGIAALALIVTPLALAPAKAALLDYSQTHNGISGFDLHFLADTGSDNVVDSILPGGTVTGFGVFAGYSGAISGLITNPPGDPRWAYDNVLNPTAPFFSPTSSSGLLFTWNGGLNFGNPYYDLATNSYFFSVALTPPNTTFGSDNPGLIMNTPNVQPVPIPAAAWLFGSGLVGLLALGRGRKKKPQNGVKVSMIAA